ncbi:MAG: hypothetical protein K5857_00230 [Lachnospiraceae bacterium]|nr:hypothetical protein [Lachnospiraceae bacterium]
MKKTRLMPLFTASVLTASLLMSGCNRAGDDAAEEPAVEQAAQTPVPKTIQVSGTAGPDRDINFIRTPYGEGYYENAPADAFDKPADNSDLADPDEAPPQYFDVEDPIEPVMGYCDNDMCDRLIEQLNMQRTNFGVGNVEKNYSLCVAADVRGREYGMYPVYKERPDGRSFTTVSPQGYVRDEYFCIPARNTVTPKWDAQKGIWTNPNPSYKEYTYTPATVMEGLMEIREARSILLNEDYKQVGATWFVTGSYFIAGFTFSY